jgi:replicative DNA helicase
MNESFEMSERPSREGGRVPPHSLDAERAVLGGVLLENGALNTVLQLLSAEDFYSRGNSLVFDAMAELFRRGQPVDTITLRSWLVDRGNFHKAGGDEHLLSLTNTIPTVANIEQHANIVREKANVRRLIAACHEIAAAGYGDYGEPEEYFDNSEKRVFEIGKARGGAPYEHIKDIVYRTIQQVQEAAGRGERIIGLPTGLEKLDEMTAGLKGSELLIIAGRPGMGKTAFALNVALAAAAGRNVGVAVFSLEMRKEELVRRLLCSEARVDGGRMRNGMLSTQDWQKLMGAAGPLTDLPLFIDDTAALTVTALRARRLKSEHGLGLIVVDYLQLMRGDDPRAPREQQVAAISRGLKALAKELDVNVIALSQLNRSLETRAEKRPMTSDLRESGSIEQDADIIMFIYRDEVYNPETDDKGIAEIIIAKQRGGAIGTVRLAFQGQFTRFDNLARDALAAASTCSCFKRWRSHAYPLARCARPPSPRSHSRLHSRPTPSATCPLRTQAASR